MIQVEGLAIEFAEEFSKKEKIERIILHSLVGIFIVITHQKWVFPYINWYAKTAACHTPFGYSGITVLWYSLFVGLPLLSAILIGGYSVPLGVKGLRDRQFPPKGVKVYKPTKIARGWQSNTKSVGHLLAPLFFVAIAVWGSLHVDKLPNSAEKFDYSLCKR